MFTTWKLSCGLATGLMIATVSFLTIFTRLAMADGNIINRYIVGTADDEFGLFPFPPWDVIDPQTGENVGLDGQFIRAIDAANKKMKVTLRGVPYSDCGASSDPFVLGRLLAKGVLDGCSTWGETNRRKQAGATFGPAVQSRLFAPKGVLIKRDDDNSVPYLPDTNNALDMVSVGEVAVVGGFLADVACLKKHYPESSNVRAKTMIGTEAQVDDWVANGTTPYAWLIMTET